MSKTIVRLLMSLALFPAGKVVGSLLAMIFVHTTVFNTLSLAGFLYHLIVFGSWLGVWYGAVNWTSRRKRWTLVLALVAPGASLLAAWLVRHLTATGGPQNEFLYEAAWLSDVGLAVWVFGTAMVWRETKDERLARLKSVSFDGLVPKAVHCPQCGYHMAGLSQARCPECGTEYTLEALLAANVERANPDRVLENA